MAIWYVDPLSTSATGVGTYANPFGIMNNTSMNGYVNNGDEIRILGKDITTLSSYNWTMKPFRINDGTTAYGAGTYNGLGLKVVTGTAYTGSSYIIYCLELDMFCFLNYDSSYYTYSPYSGMNQLNYLLELNNLNLNSTLTFYAINSSTYSLAQNRYLCCFTSTKSYLTISDNWTSATTRSTGVNKIMSLMMWGNTNQYSTTIFQNVSNSTIDCSNTAFVSNIIQPSYNDTVVIGPLSYSTINIKNVNHCATQSLTASSYVTFTGTCINNSINIKYFCPPRSGQGVSYNTPKINGSNSGDSSNYLNITVDHYFLTWDASLFFYYGYKQNLNYTIKNLIYGTSDSNLIGATPDYYSFLSLISSPYLGTNTKTVLNFGQIYMSSANYAETLKTSFASKYYVFDSVFKYALNSKLIELNLLSNFNVKVSYIALGYSADYYSSGIPLYVPEYKYGSCNAADTALTSNASGKTTFIETLNNTFINVRNVNGNTNSLVEYDFQKLSNCPLRIKQMSITSTTLDQAYPNFLGNYTLNDVVVLKNNATVSKFLPINSSSISATSSADINMMKIDEDYITFKTISPAISMFPFTNGKTNFYSGKVLYKHSLNIKKGKNYNLSFSLCAPGFSLSDFKVYVIDDINIYPVTLSGDLLSKWETITFNNLVSTADQFLTIVIDMSVNTQKCKLTLSDIILTQLN